MVYSINEDININVNDVIDQINDDTNSNVEPSNNLFVTYARTTFYRLRPIKVYAASLWKRIPKSIQNIQSRYVFNKSTKNILPLAVVRLRYLLFILSFHTKN